MFKFVERAGHESRTIRKTLLADYFCRIVTLSATEGKNLTGAATKTNLMKTYFLHDGKTQQGPFALHELKLQSIAKQTPIWCEGMQDWTPSEHIPELKELFHAATPPPFKATPSVSNTTKTILSPVPTNAAQTSKKKKSYRPVLLIGVLLIVGYILLAFYYNNFTHQNNLGEQSYQEKIMTVEEMERAEPLKFLNADAEYNTNFWGNKFKIRGKIKNNATVATYKDAVVRITYYSKTKTEMGSKDFTIYETLPPNLATKFELKVDNYQGVQTIGCDVVDAKAN